MNKTKRTVCLTLLAGVLLAAFGPGAKAAETAEDPPATYAFKTLSVETAFQAAWGALKECRKQGYSVTVAVVAPLTAKSAASTPITASSKVARNTNVSAFVGLVVGIWRVNEVKCGAAVSLRASRSSPPE